MFNSVVGTNYPPSKLQNHSIPNKCNMDGKHQNQKQKWVKFCGLFWKNCTDLTSDKF